jgi:hypothetical protein
VSCELQLSDKKGVVSAGIFRATFWCANDIVRSDLIHIITDTAKHWQTLDKELQSRRLSADPTRTRQWAKNKKSKAKRSPPSTTGAAVGGTGANGSVGSGAGAGSMPQAPNASESDPDEESNDDAAEDSEDESSANEMPAADIVDLPTPTTGRGLSAGGMLLMASVTDGASNRLSVSVNAMGLDGSKEGFDSTGTPLSAVNGHTPGGSVRPLPQLPPKHP